MMRNRYLSYVLAVHSVLLLHTGIATAQTPAEYFDRALQAHRAEKFDEALADYSRVIQLRPNVPEPYCNRALIHYAKRSYDAALADVSKAIEINPKMTSAYLHRYEVYDVLRKDDLAVADLTKVIELSPSEPTLYYKRGLFHARKLDKVRAIADFSKAIELDPKHQLAFIERGMAYGSLKENERALADLVTAISLNPSNSRAFSSRGLFYKFRRMHDLAIADFTKAIELDPERLIANSWRAEEYLNKGSYDLAIAEYTMLIERDEPGMRTFYYDERGKAHRRNGSTDLAVADFKRAFELDPTRDQTHEIVLTYLSANKNDLAYERALSFSGDQKRWGFRIDALGYIAARRLRKTVEARAMLERMTKDSAPDSNYDLLSRYLNGKLSADELLAKTDTTYGQGHARLMIGETLMLAGKPAAAKVHFEWIRDNDEGHFWGVDLAIANLRRISSSKAVAPAKRRR